MDNGLALFEVTKANGEKSTYDPKKLFNSLTRSGADEIQANEIVNSISSEIYPGISTKKIYKRAFSLLKQSSRFLAARYNLKNAIMMLGPSGYPFERFIGQLLKSQGYKVEVAKIVAGKCVNHEVDVIAEKDSHHVLIECKYHNQQGAMSDVKIPLYIQSRFLDVAEQLQHLPGHEQKFHQGWVVTNTRFTTDAIRYGNCAGLKLVGWDFPIKGSLKDMIDSLGLYPVTTLTSLTAAEKKALLELELIMCHDLPKNETVLTQIGIKPQRKKAILEECQDLCEHAMKNSSSHDSSYANIQKHYQIPH